MALCSGIARGEAQNSPFKATQLWREIITSFRGGMPRRKKRVKIRVYEECFAGHEAVEWLHFYLQTSGNFGNVSREQVLKLLQKFLDSDVIRDVRGKLTRFDPEGSTLYCFVTEPGPLNFVEDMDTSGYLSSPSRQRTPLRKHTRQAMAARGEQVSNEFDDTLFTNEYAFMNDSMNDSTMEVSSICSRTSSGAGGGGSIRSRPGNESDSSTPNGSPVKKCRNDSLQLPSCSKLSFSRQGGGRGAGVNSPEKSRVSVRRPCSSPRLVQLTPAQVASVWKDLTLHHLLQLVELETLEGVLAYDAVDGKQIASNCGTFLKSRTRALGSLASSATSSFHGSSQSLPSVGSGRGGVSVSRACGSGVGSTHPHRFGRRFGSRVSRVQPTPEPPPAANVHGALYRSRSARSKQHSKKTSSSLSLPTSNNSSSLTLHHKLRFSIKSTQSGDESTSTHPLPTAISTSKTAISSSRSSSCLVGGAEGGRGRESVMDVPQWVVLAMKCLAKWPDGCTEEFVGSMPIYGGFELDVLQSLVQYFNSLPDPLISPKLFDLHMAVLRLVKDGKPSAVDALQLCSLLLPQTNRTRLHRVLRLIHKASYNRQLVLSKTKSNRDVLLDSFATIVLKSTSHSVSPLHLPSFGRSDHGSVSGSGQEEEKESLKRLVSFMSHHYQQIFKMPENLKKEVQKRLELLSAGKSGSPLLETKAFCHRVSSAEYEQQRLSVTDSLTTLLDNILTDTSMNHKLKKQRLKQFQKAYPEIYASRLVGGALTEATPSNVMRNSMPNLHAVVAPSPAPSDGGAGYTSDRGNKPSKERPLSKLASNNYSTDCLSTTKPVLR